MCQDRGVCAGWDRRGQRAIAMRVVVATRNDTFAVDPDAGRLWVAIEAGGVRDGRCSSTSTVATRSYAAVWNPVAEMSATRKPS